MIKEYFVVGVIATAMMAGTALAQTPVPAVRADNNAIALDQAYKGQWRVYKMIGLDVYNQNNEKLGDIEELLTDQNGKIQAAILGVGGFLGMGERKVAVNFDKLKFVNEAVPSTTAANAPTTTAPATNVDNNARTTTGAATTNVRPVRTATEQWYPDHAVIDATKDQLKAMTEFKYN
ncbi:PRC-barrel domain containing protein [Tardiphaga sp. vice352]|uniref:PRC-barrel domain-containing protein n=1 Tax=unclassified Tardiphaga TaxID=2631404 RepID=UPI0011652261|nr:MULTISPECIES: PRC-barrel domain-containing protein [unclassified Tardiphaga]QDM15511.1 PRC-barrel domain containing protein [Tardiphaga sp. vice278]QDM20540.1 PRC-barrel domain containing protein [Tardiphaga sp. vice154]QDM25668.1 PRC-barrel domain containing protein [Tardiphaga sp. vice304]QDM30881.1 PRC-barrel domain containing protein [Tardiphaga sp. vice352]